MDENITSLGEINIGSTDTNGDTRRALYCDRHIERIGHKAKCLVTDNESWECENHINIRLDKV